MHRPRPLLKAKSVKERKALPDTVLAWFVNALRQDDPRPSPASCAKLAGELQTIANRCNNVALERSGIDCSGVTPPKEFLDVDQRDWQKRKIQNFMDAANRLLFAAEDLEGFCGDYRWTLSDGSVSLSEIQYLLLRIGAVPRAIIDSKEAISIAGRRIFMHDIGLSGRDREAWHTAAHPIAHVIEAAMQGINYRGSLNKRKPDGVVAQVGASAINWLFVTRKQIEPEGFVSAVKLRDRWRSGRQPTIERILSESPPLVAIPEDPEPK